MITKNDLQSKPSRQHRCERFFSSILSPSSLIYTVYFLASWGDQMWNFTIALYLVKLSGDRLRLAAILGFVGGCSVLLLGGIIGNWVDATNRLKVVRVTLIVQNVATTMSAIVVTLYVVYDFEQLAGGALRYVGQAVIIGLSIIAQLSKVGYTVAIEKDWFVVIAGDDRSKLANLNAVTRAINLVCRVLAPPLAGQIITYATPASAAVAIAIYSVLEIFIEYAMIWWVYHEVPRLAVKQDNSQRAEENKALAEANQPNLCTAEKTDHLKSQVPAPIEDCKQLESSKAASQKSCLRMAFDPFIIVVRSWRVYVRQRVLLAGISLALLYMTVLSFDSITTGYIYTSGVSASVISICSGLSGLTGLIGTFFFTRLRKHLSLDKTGLFSLGWEVSCLGLCVLSLWIPGSHFEPYVSASGYDASQLNCTSFVQLYSTSNGTMFNFTSFTSSNTSSSIGGKVLLQCTKPGYRASIILLILGIITSRVGLWMADLVISQVMQENVLEHERGMVGGVQNSLNQLLDMIKYALVIFVPDPRNFGYLVILTFVFIFSAGCSFAAYTRSKRVSGDDPNRQIDCENDVDYTTKDCRL